jgi:hypothetical protein
VLAALVVQPPPLAAAAAAVGRAKPAAEAEAVGILVQVMEAAT